MVMTTCFDTLFNVIRGFRNVGEQAVWVHTLSVCSRVRLADDGFSKIEVLVAIQEDAKYHPDERDETTVEGEEGGQSDDSPFRLLEAVALVHYLNIKIISDALCTVTPVLLLSMNES